HGLSACSDDMDMRRSMIVGIYDHAMPIKPMNGRHRVSVSETQALGNVLPRLPKRRAQASQCVRPALIPPASYVIPLRPCPPPAGCAEVQTPRQSTVSGVHIPCLTSPPTPPCPTRTWRPMRPAA